MRDYSLHIFALLMLSTSAFALEPEATDHFETTVRPVLVKYCGDCHDPADEDNKIDFLKAQTADDLSRDRELWKNVSLQLRNRTMPPVEEEQPPEEDRFQLSIWIADTLKSTACQNEEYAGPITARRLNRIEYDYTIQDLIGLDMQFADFLPADGSGGEGFNNNGETLFLPPLLLERYLEAAQTVLDKAVITPRLENSFHANAFFPAAAAEEKFRTIEPGSEAGVIVNIYLEGSYNLKLYVQSTTEEKAKAVLKVDGIAANRFEVSPLSDDDKQHVSAKVNLSRGMHSLAVHVPKGGKAVKMRQISFWEDQRKPSQAQVAAHRRIFPPNVEQNRDGAKRILKQFSTRAFRRPVEAHDVERFLQLYDRAIERGDPFSEALKLSLRMVLISPQFLFRLEPQPEKLGLQKLDDYSLATRLSYFLWSSMPDEELFALAREGKLNDQKVLNQQVTRMLADPKSKRFAEEFTGQWLGTHEVARRIVPSTSKFKGEFNTELLIDLRNEPVQFMHHLMTGNGNLLDIIQADYSYITARLAKQYQVKGIQGKEFQKYVFEDGTRGGALGMGGVHLLTSYPNRTSQVLRGAWVLETLLGTPVPSPPADVPPLEKAKVAKQVSMREKLQKHRENPACAACHDVIDPIGFGLDNFDVLGRWREKDGRNNIDPSGVMPDGQMFQGPKELKAILVQQKEEFLNHLTEKMLGYALGRSLLDDDQCVVQRLVVHVKEKEYQTQALIRGIVVSHPFRMIQVPANNDSAE